MSVNIFLLEVFDFGVSRYSILNMSHKFKISMYAHITNKLSYTESTLASLLHEIGSSMRCVAIFRLLRLRAIFFRGDLSPYYKILFLVLDYSSILYIVLYLAIELSRFSLYFSTYVDT